MTIERLKEDLAIAARAMSMKDYKGSGNRWREPTAREMAAICAGSFALWFLGFR